MASVRRPWPHARVKHADRRLRPSASPLAVRPGTKVNFVYEDNYNTATRSWIEVNKQGLNLRADGNYCFRMFQIVVWIGHGTVSSRLFCQTGAPEAGKQIKQKSLRTEMPKKWIPHCKDKQVWYKLFLDLFERVVEDNPTIQQITELSGTRITLGIS